jgi:hypothetical protein
MNAIPCSHITVSSLLYRTVSHAFKQLLLRPASTSLHSLPQVVSLCFWVWWSLDKVVFIFCMSSGSTSTQQPEWWLWWLSPEALGIGSPPKMQSLSFISCGFKHAPPFATPVVFCVTKPMAPVVRMESNGSQALLSHDDVVDDLVAYGWDGFIKLFEGFNLKVCSRFFPNLRWC